MGKGNIFTTAQRRFMLVALLLFALLLAPGVGWGQTIIAAWNFPNNTDNATCDGGIAANLAKTITAVGASIDNFSSNGNGTRCASATGWDVGNGTKYWTINIVTAGYSNIKVSSEQKGRSNNPDFGPKDFRLEYNIGNGWIPVVNGNIIVANDWSGVLSNLLLPDECSNVATLQLRWIMTSNTRVGGGGTVSSTGYNRIDNIVVSGTPLPPSLTITPSTLDFGFTPSGTTSANQTFILSGAYLTADLTIKAPAGFEISTSASSGFAGSTSSITVSPTGGTINNVPIYVRFKPTAPNTNYSGNVTISGGGLAATQNVAVSGTSIPPSPVYYSYQTGSWNTANTWTTDPSGTTLVGSAVPSANDNVVILSNRTVTLPANVATDGLKVTINDGGILDLGGYQFTAAAGLSSLGGQGTLRIASAYFPKVTTNSFVLAGGGTTEFYNATSFTLPSQATYNHLRINAPGWIATQMANITLNGDLLVKAGTFQINDNASNVKKQLTVMGDVIVESQGKIKVGQGATNSAIGGTGGTAPYLNYYENFHRVVIYGNLTNKGGEIRFTNLDKPLYGSFPPTGNGANSGAASVYFIGSESAAVLCDGKTDFYNLVLDKNDPATSLTIDPSAPQNFSLFGANTLSFDGAASANPNMRKALWIRTGSLVLKGATTIPSLSEGSVVNSDYFVPANGSLVLDGPDVVVLSTTDDYREVNVAYGTTAAANSDLGIGTSQYSSLGILGKVQVNDGYLSTRESAGITYWSYGSGQLIVNRGIVDAKQIADASGSNSGLFNYTQNGGSVLLRGRFQHQVKTAIVDDLTLSDLNATRADNGISSSVGTFSINSNANSGFTMTGGNIAIYDACNSGDALAFDVACPSANINVTGGTLQLYPTTGSGADAANFLVNTTAPLGNLTISRASGSTDVKLSSNIYLLKHLDLTSGALNAAGKDVYVGGNFSIANGTTYTTGNNRTVFNGVGQQTFTVNLASSLSLYRLKIDKQSPTDAVVFAGSQKAITVADSLTIRAGRLGDNGNTITALGGIYNSGTHYGTGKIVMGGVVAQSIDGNGSGVFQNIDLASNASDIAPVTLTANATINGTLTFTNDKLFDIGANNLTITSTGSIVGATANRYIQTSGQAGDGGVTFAYSASKLTNTFPVGAKGASSTSHSGTSSYTPATIGFSSAPSTIGSITVTPVGYEHPATTVNGQSLTGFWRVKSTGFVGIAANSITHSFTYADADIKGTESNYVPALYDRPNYKWNIGTAANPPINTTSNIFIDWTTPTDSRSILDGDYTAGVATSFGKPTIYYSRATNVDWDVNSTWSTDGINKHNGAAASSYPKQNDIVVIGNNHKINLAENESCASLQIESGAVLDIKNYTGSNFGMVLSSTGGNGLFRLKTTDAVSGARVQLFIFPTGDFSDFNVNKGTTEFYSTTNNMNNIYILPSNVASYGNLKLSPSGLDNLSLPNNNLTTIYGDLICNSSNMDSWIAMSWNTKRWSSNLFNPTIEKTVVVKGNLDILGGTLVYMDDFAPQHLIVEKNVTIYSGSSGAGISVKGNGSVYLGGSSQQNTFEIGGNFINNSNPASSNSAIFYDTPFYCDVTFSGTSNTSISGSGNTTFRKVTINKGNSQATTLTCNIGGTLSTPSDSWLTLQNGTFKYERTGNLNITTTSSFTIPSSSGLYINSPSNIYLANNNSSDNTVYLSGKLTLAAGNSGNVYIGNSANSLVHNDIEYSSGGASEIEVNGGSLVVNGQVRRNPSNAAGVLGYTQAGGTVTLYGNKAAGGANATLEVLNSGSSFSMLGGDIKILKGGGGTNTFGDLYLRPESSTVSGGTITLGTTSAQIFKIDSSVPLYNLTINGSGGANTVNLMVNPLVLNGNLTLSNTNSIIKTNNIDVTIKGNLTNNGSASCYNYGTNTTLFNGNVQSINGSAVTNFNNLTVNPLTSLDFVNSFTAGGNLFIANGTLKCDTKKVTVNGNVVNNGTYTDSNGGLVLTGGTTQHQVSGNGTFGTLELNDVLGTKLFSNISLNNNLVMTAGILDINKYLLSLGLNGNIAGAPFSASKMITSDGVFSNVGILKFFKAEPATFTYPLGSGGKYTPAVLTISANGSVGSIRINNINDRHPSVLDANKVLKYYWEVESTSISGFAGNLVLNYNDADVKGAEDQYVAAKILVPGADWYKAAAGASTDNVDENQNKITFQFNAGTSNISGEYTAGEDPAFPAVVKTYTSIADGDWSDKNIWSPVAPDGGPNGAIVVVNNVVTAKNNYTFSYRTTINGTLKIDPATYGHNLGTVTGSGKLYLESGLLPAGRFDSFFDCATNSTLEYGGSDSYTIVADLYDKVANLIVSGTGTRYYPNKDLTICKLLDINGAATNGAVLDNTLYNKKLTILGEMKLSSGGFRAGTGSGAVVSFAGSAKQKVSTSANAFVGANKFNSLEINNAAGLDLTGQLEVDGNLYLTNGVINTSTTNRFTITNSSESCIYPAGGTESSYINGPLTKRMNTGDYYFVFPVGDSRYGYQISLKATFSNSDLWTVQYFANNPTYMNLTSPLVVVNSDEYWTVTASNSSAKGYVKLGWDTSSGLTPLMTQNGISDMRVAEYKSNSWKEVGTASSGDSYNGAVETSGQYIFGNSSHNFTTASISSILPKAKLSPTGPVCGSSGIPVTFTANGMTMNFPYTLNYLYNNTTPMSVAVISTPFLLPTPNAGTYKLVSFTYNNGANVGVVDSKTTVTSYANPTKSEAGPDQSLCGATSATLAGNVPTVGVGTWVIISGAGGTVTSPTVNTSTITGTNGSSYGVRWTIDNGGCTSADDVQINFTLKPAAPSITSTQSFCSGATLANVSVSVGAGTTLVWYDAATGGSVLPSTTVVTDAKKYYAQADNGCTSDSRSEVTTNITPNVSVTNIADASSNEPKCKLPNGTTQTNYTSTISNSASYAWSIDNALAGSINSTSGVMTWSDGFVGTVNIKLEASGCGPVATTSRMVTVNSLPTPELSVIAPVCAGEKPTISLTKVYSDYLWSVTTSGYSFPLSEKNVATPILTTPNNDTLFPTTSTELVSYPDVKVVVTDTNGCQNSVTNNSVDKKITINRIPRTGPPYHVGNNVAK